MRISDWSSDVCSSDLPGRHRQARVRPLALGGLLVPAGARGDLQARRLWQRAAPPGAVRTPDRGAAGGPASESAAGRKGAAGGASAARPGGLGIRATRHSQVIPAEGARSEEHTSELQSLMRISYAVFCLKKKKTIKQ